MRDNRWYPDKPNVAPRVTSPCRDYTAHVAGIELKVRGLAWQQQDNAVGACATVALWSMFHSSALDEHHAIPTTAEITESAHVRWPLAHRVFPAADGLSIHQVCEAIRAQELQASVLEGDVAVPTGRLFSPRRFAASCAALIRSGYPVLIGGTLETNRGGHAVCAVGFRPQSPSPVPAGEAWEDDGSLQHLYVHDDNLGPSVRFALDTVKDAEGNTFVALRPDAPTPPLARPTSLPDPTNSASRLLPSAIIAALPQEIRMTSDELHDRAIRLATAISLLIEAKARHAKVRVPGVTFAARFYRLRDYLGSELADRLSGSRLRKARLGLATRIPPMSLHVGLVRVGIGGTPLFDVLYDTTDSAPGTAAFAHLIYQKFPVSWLHNIGVPVAAF